MGRYKIHTEKEQILLVTYTVQYREQISFGDWTTLYIIYKHNRQDVLSMTKLSGLSNEMAQTEL